MHLTILSLGFPMTLLRLLGLRLSRYAALSPPCPGGRALHRRQFIIVLIVCELHQADSCFAGLCMWCVRSRHGASSGLHHDYHDNLYVLLKGRKRFQLFAPGEAPRMYVHLSTAGLTLAQTQLSQV
jgi:hypothetical protein